MIFKLIITKINNIMYGIFIIKNQKLRIKQKYYF